MADPDLPPIPPSTLRVTVVWPDGRHDPVTVDITTGTITTTLRSLEDRVGSAMTIPRTRRATYAAMAAALRAADDGDVHVVTSAGLWLFLHHHDAGQTNGQRLADAMDRGGSALLLALVGRGGGGWRYRLHPMPRWPEAVRHTHEREDPHDHA